MVIIFQIGQWSKNLANLENIFVTVCNIFLYVIIFEKILIPIVQFQKISILLPQKGLEFPAGLGVLWDQNMTYEA